MQLLILVASILFAKAFAAVVRVDVGKVPLTFSPEVVQAEVSDVLEFHFYPQAHSVVLGKFDQPCAPVNNGGFFSGFVPVQPGGVSVRKGDPRKKDRPENPKLICPQEQVFKVTVEHTRPMFMYCSQGQHCPMGMVMAVNPSGNQTLSAYALNAVGRPVFSPFPNEPFGGEFGLPTPVGEGKGHGTCSPSPTTTPRNDRGGGDGSREAEQEGGDSSAPQPGSKSTLGALVSFFVVFLLL